MRKPLFWILALMTGLLVQTAAAQFQQNRYRFTGDSSGVKIRTGTYMEWQRAISPGENGNWYIAYTQTRGNARGLYVTKVNASGNIVWDKVVNDGPGHQYDPVLQMTPSGLVVAWVDWRNDESDCYAQKLNFNGDVQWPAGSADTVHAVIVADSTKYQTDLRILSDGGDGVLIFWEDYSRGQGADIFGARLLSNGTFAPGFARNGVAVGNGPANQPFNAEYTVDIDGRGGAWIAWTDNIISADPNIHLQQLRSNGTTRWPSNNTFVLCSSTSEQNKVKLAPDGRGGGYVVWRDAGTDSSGIYSDLFMQRFDSLGVPMWQPAANGVRLTNVPGDQTGCRIVEAGMDSVIVSWEDYRNDPTGNANEDIYINKITGTTGIVKLWGANGTVVCSDVSHQRESRLASDGASGAVVVWEDERNGNEAPFQNCYAQRVNRTGTAMWGTNGRALVIAEATQFAPVCRESGSQYLFAWCDGRKGSFPVYRSVWNGAGTPVATSLDNGAVTVTDISGNVSKHQILINEPDRFFSVWVDARRTMFGSRLYYSVNNMYDGVRVNPSVVLENGVPLTTDSTNTKFQEGANDASIQALIGTEDLGAIVVFPSRDSTSIIRAQKITRDGVRSWSNLGVQVSEIVESPSFLSGVSDGENGAYFCYTVSDMTTFFTQLFFQHISSSGTRTLGLNGIAVRPESADQSFATMAKSGNNMYLGYISSYDMTRGWYAVRISKMNTNGTIAWTTVVADSGWNNNNVGPTGARYQLKLLPGSDGSVIAYWQEMRYESNGAGQIYAQKVLSNGAIAWTQGGVRLAPSSEDQSVPSATQSGTQYWFAWDDMRTGNTQIYTQSLNESGARVLDSLGRCVSANPKPQNEAVLSYAANGGTYIIWEQTKVFYPSPSDSLSETDLLGTHLASNGTFADAGGQWNWGGLGNPVRFPYMQVDPRIARNSWGGATMIWRDMRATGKEELIELYAQRVESSVVSVREVPAAAVQQYELGQNYPNPFNSTTAFRFTLPQAGHVKIALYDALGREVINLLSENRTAGTHEVRWSGRNWNGEKVASGIYFYRMEVAGKTMTKKLALIN